MEINSLGEKLALLRSAFDESFAIEARKDEGSDVTLIVLSAAERRFALRVSELAGVRLLERAVTLPGAPRALLGLAGIRRRIVPVFDAAALLGCAEPGDEDEPRWLCLCEAEGDTLAFAFHRLEAQVRAGPAEIQRLQVKNGDERGASELFLSEGKSCPLLSIATLVAAAQEVMAGTSRGREG